MVHSGASSTLHAVSELVTISLSVISGGGHGPRAADGRLIRFTCRVQGRRHRVRVLCKEERGNLSTQLLPTIM